MGSPSAFRVTQRVLDDWRWTFGLNDGISPSEAAARWRPNSVPTGVVEALGHALNEIDRLQEQVDKLLAERPFPYGPRIDTAHNPVLDCLEVRHRVTRQELYAVRRPATLFMAVHQSATEKFLAEAERMLSRPGMREPLQPAAPLALWVILWSRGYNHDDVEAVSAHWSEEAATKAKDAHEEPGNCSVVKVLVG